MPTKNVAQLTTELKRVQRKTRIKLITSSILDLLAALLAADSNVSPIAVRKALVATHTKPADEE